MQECVIYNTFLVITWYNNGELSPKALLCLIVIWYLSGS